MFLFFYFVFFFLVVVVLFLVNLAQAKETSNEKMSPLDQPVGKFVRHFLINVDVGEHRLLMVVPHHPRAPGSPE